MSTNYLKALWVTNPKKMSCQPFPIPHLFYCCGQKPSYSFGYQQFEALSLALPVWFLDNHLKPWICFLCLQHINSAQSPQGSTTSEAMKALCKGLRELWVGMLTHASILKRTFILFPFTVWVLCRAATAVSSGPSQTAGGGDLWAMQPAWAEVSCTPTMLNPNQPAKSTKDTCAPLVS